MKKVLLSDYMLEVEKRGFQYIDTILNFPNCVMYFEYEKDPNYELQVSYRPTESFEVFVNRVSLHKNGFLDSIDGMPSRITYIEGTKEEYYQNNLRHNTSGPSIIEYDENNKVICKEFFINGQLVSEDEFNFKTKIL